MGIVAAQQEKLSAWLSAHPVAAWVATIVMMFAVLTATPASVLDEAGPVSVWVPVAVVVLMAYGATTAVLFPRVVRRRPDEVLAIQLGMLLAVFCVGWVGALGGAGRWLPGLGFLLVAGGWLLCSRQARHRQQIG